MSPLKYFKSLKKRFKKLKEVIKSLCKKEIELNEFIHIEKLNFDTLDSTNNVFNILNTEKLFSDPIYFKWFTGSCLQMLRSTSIACPHLSISLIQWWFPLMSNLVSASVKKNIDCSIIIKYNINRYIMLKLAEWVMLGFKRIAITKSFEITQVRVVIQCMIRAIRFLSQTIEYDEEFNDSIYADYLNDEYIYCCNIIFWICISCIQTTIVSASNRSVKSIITIGLSNLVSLLNEKKFKIFFWETERFSKNFQNYSVFSSERRSQRNSTFSSNFELDGNYLCLYDILFKCLQESGTNYSLIV